MGLLLQDMDLIVKTVMAVERDVDDAWIIRDTGVKDKRNECNTPKYTLVVFDMFRVFCKHNLTVS